MNQNIWAMLDPMQVQQMQDPSQMLLSPMAQPMPQQMVPEQVQMKRSRVVSARAPQSAPQPEQPMPQGPNLEQQYLEGLQTRQQNVKSLRDRFAELAGQGDGWQGVNLKPALAFADSLMGTNTAQSYSLPVTQRQKEMMQVQALADKEGQALSDDQLNLMRLKEMMAKNQAQQEGKDEWLDTWKKMKMAELGLGRDKLNDQAAKSDKPSSEAFKAAGFAKRLQQSEDVFGSLMESGYQGPTRGDQALSFLPKEAQSQNYRKYDQATRNFINATLRRESGAAISPSEFKNAEEQYLPKPGDTPEVLAQKKANRMQVYENFKAEGGSAFERIPYVNPTTQKVEAAEVTVSNGKETLTIPRSDLKDAIREGFREVK